MTTIPTRFTVARQRAAAGTLIPALLLLAGTGLGGCNNRQNELLEQNRALTDRNQALIQENESLQASVGSLTSAVDARDRSITELRNLAGDLRSENLRLSDAIRQLDERFRDIRFGQLDPDTDRALRELAAQFPNLITYDADRGMVRFTSDLTFASGSAEVTAQGRQSLEQFARILQQAAGGYDVRIVGHTDSQRISANTAQRHPTNWHLSAHRAIAAMQELTRTGVAAERVEIAGRGEHMPMVPNTQTGNTPQNRRVEIYLVRSLGRSPAAATAPAASAAPRQNNPAPAAARPATRRVDDDIVK